MQMWWWWWGVHVRTARWTEREVGMGTETGGEAAGVEEMRALQRRRKGRG